VSEFSFKANGTAHSPSNIGRVVSRLVGGSKDFFLPAVGKAYSATDMLGRKADDKRSEHARCLFRATRNQRRRM
jgi:hypothetical protein